MPTKVINRVVPHVNNPVVENAFQSVEGRVPMSVGQRTGNVALQRIGQGLENVPGSSTKAQRFYRGQQQALSQAGEDLARERRRRADQPYGAGQAIQERLAQRITNLKGQAGSGSAVVSEQPQRPACLSSPGIR